MAIIQSYPITHNIKASDLLLGVANISSTERPEYITTSFRIGDIAASASTIATSYGQLSRVTDSPIVFNAVNVYQPLGVIGSLSSTGSGFSLGTTDKFALKNISGNAKTVNVSAYLALSYTDINYYNTMVFGLAINGTIINESTATTFPSDDYRLFTRLYTDWIVTLQNGDEVSIYIKTDEIPTTATFKAGRLVATQV